MSKAGRPDLEGLRQRLALETLYDLLIALREHGSEQELMEDLLQRLCAIVDPGAAVAVTREASGSPVAVATAGWDEPRPTAADLLSSPLWSEVHAHGGPIRLQSGRLLGRAYQELYAVPLDYRGSRFGFLAVIDKEHRGGGRDSFSVIDRRFLEAVAALSAVAIDGLRQLEHLVRESERLEQENRMLREQLIHEVQGQRIIAAAPAMKVVLAVAERVAPRNVNVLIRGESGTGKELMARLLHERSGRSGSLVAVNCAALPETLLESELFGIEGGVATGVAARVGRVELADGGTLFLDEIGDLELSLQVKILRVLQEREVLRVGGHRAKQVDIRLISASHRPLEALVAEGKFREDLYYRLKGVELLLPPLRDRREDIPHLVRYFVERFCEREGIAVPTVSREGLSLLLRHDFNGNVRELQGLVEGAAALADGLIDANLLASLIGGEDRGSGPEALDLETLERRHIRRVLKMTAGNKSAAAKILGIDRRTLARKGYSN